MLQFLKLPIGGKRYQISDNFDVKKSDLATNVNMFAAWC